MSLTPIERETVIIFNDAENMATITSSQQTVWTNMEKRGVKPDKEETLGGRVVTKVFTVPRSWIKIHPSRQMSEAQREAVGERFKAARMAQDVQNAHEDNGI